MKNTLRIFVLALIAFSIIAPDLSAQDASPMPTNETEAEKQYKRNIKKRRINGTFIPANLEDAIKELKELTPAESLASFRSANEEMVVRKLHFGIGRWIRYNWNFYEGSRLSHAIKQMGLSHPDDMSTLILTLLHRDLNGTEYGTEELIAKLQAKRNAKNQIGKELISTQTRKVEKGQ